MFVKLAIAAVIVAGSLLYSVMAQSPRPAEANDAIAALVAELRAVRVDLADAAQRSLRFQLLLARLQLQEQRLGHLDRQRAEVSKALLDAQSMAAMFAPQFEQLEKGCKNAPPDEREACEAQIATMNVTLSSQRGREQQLRQQEQDLSQAIATEQNRWSDFSARLDELERALARPR